LYWQFRRPCDADLLLENASPSQALIPGAERLLIQHFSFFFCLFDGCSSQRDQRN
jgi:hypothetical protein